jgi:hypothetical protein
MVLEICGKTGLWNGVAGLLETTGVGTVMGAQLTELASPLVPIQVQT